jgi:hypothetical protein
MIDGADRPVVLFLDVDGTLLPLAKVRSAP